MNSDYEALIEEHCEHCYYNKNGVCNAARADKECVYGNLKHDLQELDLLRKLQKEHAKTKRALEIIKEKPIVALVDYKYTYEEWLELVDEKDKDLFKNKEEFDLLKEVLL